MDDLKIAIANFPIRRWVSENFTRVSSSNRGEFLRVDCPFCGGRNTLSIDTRKKYCRCFRCEGKSVSEGSWSGRGGIVDLVCAVEGIDVKSGIARVFQLSEFPDTVVRQEKPVAVDKDIPAEAIPLDKVENSHESVQGILRRGLIHLLESVYVCVDGRYARRWILPVYWQHEFVGFEAKSYVGDKPKSLFPEWFKTGEYVYATQTWDTRFGFVVVAESIFDAETIGLNAVGLFGSTLRVGQLTRLIELAENRDVHSLVWFLDSDAWTKQQAGILRYTNVLFDNYVVRVPPGQDPNSLGKDKCCDLIRAAIKVSDSVTLASQHYRASNMSR